MEKLVAVPDKRVEDLGGLYIDLKKRSFAVKNVGADHQGTYVYLEESEDKDPIPVVEEWVGKPAPEVSKKEVKRRGKELDAIQAAATEAMAMTVVATPDPAPSSEPTSDPGASSTGTPAITEETKPSILKRVFRKLFG